MPVVNYAAWGREEGQLQDGGATLACVLALCLLIQAGVNCFSLFAPGTWHSVGPHLLSALAWVEQPPCKPSSVAYVTALNAVQKALTLCEDLHGEPRASIPVFSRSKRQHQEQECSKGTHVVLALD